MYAWPTYMYASIDADCVNIDSKTHLSQNLHRTYMNKIPAYFNYLLIAAVVAFIESV